MKAANQHLQTSVQRLRIRESAILIPGSQLSAPRTLRPERSPELSMHHPRRPVVPGTTYGLAAAAMGRRPAVKRWHRAQIAAPLAPGASQVRSRSTATAVCLQTAIAVPGGASRAFAHHTTIYLFDGRNGQRLAGTDPSKSLPPRKQGGMS
jgi:hypothetical protein